MGGFFIRSLGENELAVFCTAKTQDLVGESLHRKAAADGHMVSSAEFLIANGFTGKRLKFSRTR